MKNKQSRLGLSILAGGLSFVGAANATDLIVNGSFEDPAPTGWGLNADCFSQFVYSTAYFAGPPIPSTESPGDNFSWAQAIRATEWSHYTTPNSLDYMFSFAWQYAAQQRVDLTTAVSATDIDAGLGQYTFSSWLASYGNPGTNPEQPFVWLQFFSNATGEPAASDWISPRPSSTGAAATLR